MYIYVYIIEWMVLTPVENFCKCFDDWFSFCLHGTSRNILFTKT